MKVKHKYLKNVLYMSLEGELDESKALYTRGQMESSFDSYDMSKVVIDLSGLEFMDSTGIGVLIGRFKKLKERGVVVVIANPSKSIDKILTLSGIYSLMPKVEY